MEIKDIKEETVSYLLKKQILLEKIIIIELRI